MQENDINININPQDILKQADHNLKIKAEAALSLLNNSPKNSEQLLLFENLQEYNQIQKDNKKEKTKTGLRPEQEAAAQLLVLGFGKTQTYMLTHPDADISNKTSLWVRASKFCNSIKIRLRVEDIKKAASEQALMPVTEAFQNLSELARKAVKEEVRLSATEKVLKAHGVFDDKPSVGINISLHYDKEDANA